MKSTEARHMRKGRILLRRHAQDGFSLVEVMIAVVVITVGLTGAAAMQLNAMNGVFTATAFTTGAGVSQAWMEWFSGLISQKEQSTALSAGFKAGKYYSNNFLQLSALDADWTDEEFTVVHPDCDGGSCPNCKAPDKGKACITMPATIDAMKDFLAAHNFTNAPPSSGHTAFDDDSILPPMPAAGSYMVWRIAANVPSREVTTIQVSIPFRNAFVKDMGATLTLIVGTYED